MNRNKLSVQRQAELCDEILARYRHRLDRETNVLFPKNNTGFFSNCTHSLSCLIDLANIGTFPATLNFAEAYQNYKDKDVDSSRDTYLDLFATDDLSVESIKSTLAPFHTLKTPDHHGTYAIYPYQKLTPFINAYFRPSENIRSLIAEMTKKYGIDYSRTIAICYRGSDKATEIGLADPAKYLDVAQRLSGDGMQVLVQTDQEQVRQQLLGAVGNAFAFAEMPTTSGNTVLHGLNQESLGMSKRAFGERLLAAVFIISNCKYVVNHCGNMAAWICLLRGSANGISQFDKNGNLVGPYQIFKGHLKNVYRQLRKEIRGDISCST